MPAPNAIMRADLEWLDGDDDWPLEEPPLQLQIAQTGQKMLPEPEYAGDARVNEPLWNFMRLLARMWAREYVRCKRCVATGRHATHDWPRQVSLGKRREEERRRRLRIEDPEPRKRLTSASGPACRSDPIGPGRPRNTSARSAGEAASIERPPLRSRARCWRPLAGSRNSTSIGRPGALELLAGQELWSCLCRSRVFVTSLRGPVGSRDGLGVGLRAVLVLEPLLLGGAALVGLGSP